MAGPAPVQPDLLSRFESHLGSEEETEAATEKVDAATDSGGAPEAGDETDPAAPETPDAEAEEAPEAEGTEEEAEEASIETFADLARAFGQEEEPLLQHLTIAGLDGQPVSLADVVKVYRGQGEAGVLPAQLATRQAELDKAVETVNAERSQKLGEIQALSGRLMELIEADRAVDMEKLKAEDPAEYAKLRLEQMDRREAMRVALQAQAQERERLAGEDKARFQKFQRDEQAAIVKVMPEWRDAEKRKTAYSEIGAYLDTNGFDQATYEPIVADHRVLLTVWKAAQYDRLNGKKPIVLAKLKQKIVLPKKGRDVVSESDPKGAKREQALLRKRLKETGDPRIAAKAFEAFV